MITEMTRRAMLRMIRIVLRSITTKVVHAAIFCRWFLTISSHVG